MTGTRFAARNRTPSRAVSLKLINVTIPLTMSKGEVLTPGLEPTTPGSPEESLATRLFPPEEGKSMEPHT